MQEIWRRAYLVDEPYCLVRTGVAWVGPTNCTCVRERRPFHLLCKADLNVLVTVDLRLSFFFFVFFCIFLLSWSRKLAGTGFAAPNYGRSLREWVDSHCAWAAAGQENCCICSLSFNLLFFSLFDSHQSDGSDLTHLFSPCVSYV